MLREHGTTRLNVVPNPSAPQVDPFLKAVQDAAAADFAVLGEIGRGAEGMIIYLAREATSRRLVALRLQREGTLADEFSLEVVRHLDNSMPAPESRCFKCGKAVKGWARFCSYCGADLSGAAPKEGDAAERALMIEAVKEAVAGQYEVLGEMSRNEGGGAVYFARDLATQKIVALRLQREAGGEEFSLGLTTAMKPLAQSLGVKAAATHILSAAAAPPAPPPASPPPAAPAAVAAPAPATRPSTPPPLAPAAAGTTARTRAMIGGLALVALATVVLVLSLPGDDGAVLPPAAAPATTTPAAVVPTAPTPAPAVVVRETTATSPAPAVVTPRPAPAPPPTRPALGTVRVTGLPATATVTVDGRVRTARSLSLAPGAHVVSVAVSGYRPRTDTLRVRAGETIAWSPSLTAETPARPAPKPAEPVVGGPKTPAATTTSACSGSYADEKWPEAFESCMREALAGSASAKLHLAELYDRGKGTARSDASAGRWYAEAAAGGDRNAMYQLGVNYERGRAGVKKDPAAALQWYTRAGEAGHARAQYVLGEIYEKGRLGVTRDRAKALEWYRQSAARGYKSAADKVRDLEK